tara:strand:+ start:235 stop:534 length:300 start_codon:yes stop_codon:yes gene_type:complete
MTLITKLVTHFWVTFEKVLHFRTGARAPKNWKKPIENDYHLPLQKNAKNPNANSYHLGFCAVFHVEHFSVNFDNDKKLNKNHYHWANCPDYFHFHFKAD